MTAKRFVVISILVVVAFILVSLPGAISAERQKRELLRTAKALQSLSHDRLTTAVEAFISNRQASGTARPSTVSLAELVSGGYLPTNEVATFAGKEVFVSLGIVAPSEPEAVLIRVRMTNGRDVVVMGDGSVQVMPPNKALEPTATAPPVSTNR